MSEYARYTITEAAIDEICTMLESIETKADMLIKNCRKRSYFHICEIRAQAFDFKASAQNIREYICDQIADQVQYTLSDAAIKMLEEAETDDVYAAPNEDGTWTIFDPSAWLGKSGEEE